MIKPNELMVGNLIIYAGRIITVTGIKKNLIFNGKNFDLNMEPCYEPFRGIPLTDEILCEWCGFKISPCQGFYFDVDHELQIYITRNHAISLINRQDEGEHYLLRKIRFLHQLQNLYFALTGEELTVNIQKPVAQHIK